jgi:hypothetical protein
MRSDETAAQPIDLKTDVPHSARIYDFILGGKDNFAADRAAAADVVGEQPSLPAGMRANREFMVRMTRFVVSELGIRQFLDIGTGLPTSPNLHEAAQAIAPETRVLYVDNDPIVLVHARALLTSTPEGRTAYLDADLRDPEAILAAAELRATLDLSRPVALTLIAILQTVEDDHAAYALVRRLLEPLVPGSALALTIVPDDPQVRAGGAVYRARGLPMRLRDRVAAERFFTGLELVEPGVVRTVEWHPDRPVGDVVNHNHAGLAIKH